MSNSTCSKCGEYKHQLMACKSCGFSSLERMHSKKTRRKPQQVLESPTGKLPEWDERSGNDIFDRGRVISGGGFGVGKGKK